MIDHLGELGRSNFAHRIVSLEQTDGVALDGWLSLQKGPHKSMAAGEQIK